MAHLFCVSKSKQELNVEIRSGSTTCLYKAFNIMSIIVLNQAVLDLLSHYFYLTVQHNLAINTPFGCIYMREIWPYSQ